MLIFRLASPGTGITYKLLDTHNIARAVYRDSINKQCFCFNALWFYPHQITAFAPPLPFLKETIVSDQNISILLSLLIYNWGQVE